MRGLARLTVTPHALPKTGNKTDRATADRSPLFLGTGVGSSASGQLAPTSCDDQPTGGGGGDAAARLSEAERVAATAAAASDKGATSHRCACALVIQHGTSGEEHQAASDHHRCPIMQA